MIHRIYRHRASCAGLAAVLLLIGCAANGGTTSPTVGELGASLQSMQQKLDSVAAVKDPAAAPFAYAVDFGTSPLQPEGNEMPLFRMTGSYENPGDLIYYLAVGWSNINNKSGGGEAGQLDSGKAPFGLPDGCFGNAPAFQMQPMQQAFADHAPLPVRSIDFPQLVSTMNRKTWSFGNGVRSLEITTARRLRVADPLAQACAVITYNDSLEYRPLAGVDDDRVVAEFLEMPKIFTKKNTAGNCEEGHYLILDAINGSRIESGSYERCHMIVP